MSSEGKRWTIWSDGSAISYVEGPPTGGRIEVARASELALAERVIERHRVQKDEWRYTAKDCQAEVERLREALDGVLSEEKQCGLPTVQAGTDGFCTQPKGHDGGCVDVP